MPNLIIANFPINTDKEKVENVKKDDPDLIRYIKKKAKDLEKDGIEVFDRQKNLIATENGWFGIFYKSDLKKVD